MKCLHDCALDDAAISLISSTSTQCCKLKIHAVEQSVKPHTLLSDIWGASGTDTLHESMPRAHHASYNLTYTVALPIWHIT